MGGWGSKIPILTHRTHKYNSLWRNQIKRDPYHSWKPDQYLHWGSNHLIAAKHSVFNTLAKVVSTNQQSLHKELEHIRKALQACSFPLWALNSLQYKFNCKHNIHNGQNSTDNQPNSNNNSGTNNSNSNHSNISIVVSYIQRLVENFKRTCNSRGIQVHFKGTNTIKNLFMTHKDRDNKLQKSGVIYEFKCPMQTVQKNI